MREAIYPLALGVLSSPLPRVVVAPARWKEYDAIPGNHPREWSERFSIERAHFLGAYAVGRRVGGAVVIVDGTDAVRLGGAAGLGLLWDLRVALDVRGAGIGRALLGAAERSARQAGMGGMVIETQNTNVAACELYARAGYGVTKVDATAYPDLPGEVQVVWTKIWQQGAAHHAAY